MKCVNCIYCKKIKTRGLYKGENHYVCRKPCKTIKGPLAIAEIDIKSTDNCHYKIGGAYNG